MGQNPSKSESPSSPIANHASHSKTSTLSSKASSLYKHSAAPEKPNSAQHPSSPTFPVSEKPSSLDSAMGSEQSRHRSKDDHDDDRRRARHNKTTPVAVPPRTDPRRQRGPDSQFEPSGPPRDLDYVSHSNFGLPPRLPLPIGEEIYTPGSPILDAQGSAALHEDEIEGVLPRQSSTISSTTLEDDELGNELTGQYPYADGRATVPTWLFWKHKGDKVYVTGTFTNWSRKYRMNRDPNTGHLAALLQLPPGTHHVKFIVDGEMQLSSDLPTAADYTNILVNYIEVSADDIPPSPEKIPEAIHPPQVLPEGTEAKDHAPDSVGKTQIPDGEAKAEPVFWGKELPLYLRDDKDEHPNRYQRFSRTIADFPAPPGLPLFLGKSILNGVTPMKDDSSVLNMPNHTILNHLATSSIKNNVLATSITTRYIRKYVTTVEYKPTDEDV